MFGNKTVQSSVIPTIIFALCASASCLFGGSAFGQVHDGYDLYPLYNEDGTDYLGSVPVSRDVTADPFGAGGAIGYVRLPAGSVIPEPATIVHLVGLGLGGAFWLWRRRAGRK